MSLSSPASVSIIRCPTYEGKMLASGLRKAVDLLGGLEQFVRPQQKVLVKVNHLSPSSAAERGIVTHPAFVEQVLIILKESGVSRIRVGDDLGLSSADGFSVSGLRQVCERLGVELLNFQQTGFGKVSIPQGKLLKETHLAKALMEADVVVNLPKFKTHSLTIFTGSVKNIYGFLPHGLRVSYHARFREEMQFHTLLADLFSVVRPSLNIMDAVVGMEGDGPANGDTRTIGLILASADAVALDRVALAVAGIDPEQVLYLGDAGERGLGVFQIDSIQILGERLSDVQIKDFKASRVSLGIIRKWMPGFLFQAICRQLEARPKVIAAACRGCRMCEEVCPTGAIRVSSGLARISGKQCIACMCCHEACRFAAIRPYRKLSGRLLSWGIQRVRHQMRRILNR